MSEADQLAKECGSLINVWIELLLRSNVRINAEEFVSNDSVHFNIPETDNLLSKFCPGDYLPLYEIETYNLFPECGYQWNAFLLESYVAFHSVKFQLIHPRYFGQKHVVGAIVRRTSYIHDFDTLLATVLADSGIQLTKSSALDYLMEKKYLSQRRFKEIDSIINLAKQKRQIK